MGESNPLLLCRKQMFWPFELTAHPFWDEVSKGIEPFPKRPERHVLSITPRNLSLWIISQYFSSWFLLPYPLVNPLFWITHLLFYQHQFYIDESFL